MLAPGTVLPLGGRLSFLTLNTPLGAQEGSLVEKHAVLAPGTVLPPGRLIPGGQLWAGNPARYVRDLTKDEVRSKCCEPLCFNSLYAHSAALLHGSTARCGHVRTKCEARYALVSGMPALAWCAGRASRCGVCRPISRATSSISSNTQRVPSRTDMLCLLEFRVHSRALWCAMPATALETSCNIPCGLPAVTICVLSLQHMQFAVPCGTCMGALGQGWSCTLQAELHSLTHCISCILLCLWR